MDYDNIISPDFKIVDCLKRMDEIGRKLLIIVKEENEFAGVISIGDIQRAIINQTDLNNQVSSITRNIITVANVKESREEIKAKMLELRTECMPVVDDNGFLKELIFWEDIIEEKKKGTGTPMILPVVIMAGGKGTRLQPLTNIIPKPLIPISEKTIIETIISNFTVYGCRKFYLSVNYKSDLIKYYLDEHLNGEVEVEYFEEEKPLGTAGSLTLLKGKINETFFVSNCDILVDDEYDQILEYHRNNKNELTVVAALKHISIPYGTLETGDAGILKAITEKPELTYMINSGLYVLEPGLLDEIPQNEFYHITALINKLIGEGRRVGVFPVSEGSWHDIGEWKEYFKLLNQGQ